MQFTVASVLFSFLWGPSASNPSKDTGAGTVPDYRYAVQPYGQRLSHGFF